MRLALSVRVAAAADSKVVRCKPSWNDALCLVRSLKECFVVVGILAGYLASYQYAEQVRRTLSIESVLRIQIYGTHMGGLGP